MITHCCDHLLIYQLYIVQEDVVHCLSQLLDANDKNLQNANNDEITMHMRCCLQSDACSTTVVEFVISLMCLLSVLCLYHMLC